jgi:hypothetical protein
VIEEIFERRAKKIDHENVVKAFLPKIVDIRDTSYLVLIPESSYR